MQTEATGTLSRYEVNDKAYWENYYATRKAPFEPSLFALHTSKTYLRPAQTLIELGCGNGRDAVHFAQQGLQVLAVDQCEAELDYLRRAHGSQHLRFEAGDFTRLPLLRRYHHVYSRFTMHSISTERQAAVLEWIGASLEPDGLFHLEARGMKNELFRKGEPVPGEPDAFVWDGHFRRFLDLQATSDALRGVGLTVIEAVEAKGFSPYRDQDETFMRIVARRPR